MPLTHDSGSGRGETVILRGEIAPGWRLNSPWIVDVKRSQGNSLCVTTDKRLLLVGFAGRIDDAIQNYIASLIDYYENWEKASADVKYSRKFPVIENLLQRIP